jgi:hypothetical protein
MNKMKLIRHPTQQGSSANFGANVVPELAEKQQSCISHYDIPLALPQPESSK